MVYIAESHLNYLTSALEQMQRFGIRTFDVRADEQRRFNERLQSRMKQTIWSTGGCSSWYLDDHGRNTTLWPGFTFTFRQMTRKFDLAAYDTTAIGDDVRSRKLLEEGVSA
jgi:hypothetical protein